MDASSTGRRRRSPRPALAALAVAATAVLSVVPAAPSAQAASSWDSRRVEEFSGSDLPKGCGTYSGKYQGGQSAWSAKAVDQSKGLLRLGLEKRRTDGRPYTSGGVGCWDWAQKYGKFEVRAKIPPGKGIDSYITLWPKDGAEGGWTGLELLAPDVETAYITNGYGKKTETARVAGAYSDDFHAYTIEWAPKYLRITVDGHEIFFSNRSYSGQRWFGLVVSNGDDLTGVPDADTELPAEFQIDSVKVWTWTGVAPKRPGGDPSATASATPSPLAATVPRSPSKLPATPPAATTDPVVVTPTSGTTTPALAGGIWPWLLGGSLIAAAAAALLNYPRYRRERKAR
jgi:beta-glucanase (GH16 family)